MKKFADFQFCPVIFTCGGAPDPTPLQNYQYMLIAELFN